MSDDRTETELRAVMAEGARAEETLSARRRAVAETVEARLKRVLQADPAAAFAPDELRFAAFARCGCGAGFAYPEKIGLHGAWHCAAILRGKAARGSAHSAALPFAFYEVKSEDQPSANGATTRAADELRSTPAAPAV